MQRPKKKRRVSLDRLNLTNPQKEALAELLTAQKNKYKKLLHEAHERLHIIGDLTSSLEFWFNVNGHFEHISPSCERMLGWKREEFLSGATRLEMIMHEDSVEDFRANRTRALEGESGSAEYKIIHRDGSIRWVHALWRPVHTRRGRHIGVRISLSDITERKVHQNLARNYEAMYTRLVSGVQQLAVFTLDPEGTVTSWNPSAAELTGHPAADIIGKGVDILHAEDEHDNAHVRVDIRSLHSDPTHSYMAWILRGDGSRFLANIVLTGLRDADDRLTGVVCLMTETEG